jgi:hypothetical protein
VPIWAGQRRGCVDLTSLDVGQTMTVREDEHREVSHAPGSLARIHGPCGSFGV